MRVLVVGFGRSGAAAATLAAGRGAHVVITDRRRSSELGDAVELAERIGARLVSGGHPPNLLDDVDLVVVSPGVALDSELPSRAAALTIPVWGETELAARFCQGRIVAVTGSNGKSTVTSMIGAIARQAALPGGTGGNLDEPFSSLLCHDREDACHVLELSSFQIETLHTLSAEVAVWLNLSPDHLDRHSTLERYGQAKARLFELQQPAAAAVWNADDPALEPFRTSLVAREHAFSTRRTDAGIAACLEGGWLTLRSGHGTERVLEANRLLLPGEHNVSNALAAALAARLIGCSVGSISAALGAFRPLPHRLERVGRVGEVTFYDDSKATNPDSTVCAVRSFEGREIQLILGGRDKGADWTRLVRCVETRVRRVLLVGEAAADLERRLAGVAETVRCETIARAVGAAWDGRASGDVVLLSPGCASFDQYRNFAERGEDFRRAVDELARGWGKQNG